MLGQTALMLSIHLFNRYINHQNIMEGLITSRHNPGISDVHRHL